MQNLYLDYVFLLSIQQVQFWYDKLSNGSGLKGKKIYESNSMYT